MLGTGTTLQARVVKRKDLILFISKVRRSVEFFTERQRQENMTDKLAAVATLRKLGMSL